MTADKGLMPYNKEIDGSLRMVNVAKNIFSLEGERLKGSLQVSPSAFSQSEEGNDLDPV